MIIFTCFLSYSDGLKRLLQIHSGIPSSEITLEGWPSGDGIVQDNVR